MVSTVVKLYVVPVRPSLFKKLSLTVPEGKVTVYCVASLRGELGVIVII